MRKLTVVTAFVAVLFCGCTKHNTGGNGYYFSFESGNVQYSTRAGDSLIYISADTIYTGYTIYGSLSIGGLRTQAMTDSAVAGLSTLVTWSFYLENHGSPLNVYMGDYTSDSSSANLKRLNSGSVFRFYNSSFPHGTQYYVSYGLPFTVTVTQWASSWFSGTFGGKVVKFDYYTNVYDTATIVNGKFRLPTGK